MAKTHKPNQRSKSSASDANLKPVSRAAKNRMAATIALLNAEPYNMTYEQISKAMGHESGYAHLVQHGGRVSPTKIEYQALEALKMGASRGVHQLRADVERKIKITGLAAQIQREVNEL